MFRSIFEQSRRRRFALAICLLDSACAPLVPSDSADEPIASSSSAGSPHHAPGTTSTSGSMSHGTTGDEMPGSDGSGTTVSAHDDDPPSESSTGSETEGGDPNPAVCPPTDGCFSWCGIEHSDSTCRPAEAEVIDEGAPRRCADVQMFVTASGDVELGPQTRDEDLRCFLQLLRYSTPGVAMLRWESADGQAATLRVDGRDAQTVGLSMLVGGVDVACGETIALEAAQAHVLTPDHTVFRDCLDTGHPVDARSCVLGRATDFFASHDFVYEVAFPWLTGSCSFSEGGG